MNLQQHEDRITALEEKVLGRKPAPSPQEADVKAAEDNLAAAIKRAQAAAKS